MGKINLPVFPWYGAPELVSREGRGWSQPTLGETWAQVGHSWVTFLMREGGKAGRIKAEESGEGA
jgi:hypothetical protein